MADSVEQRDGFSGKEAGDQGGCTKDKGLYLFEIPTGDEGERLTKELSKLYYLQESNQWELCGENVQHNSAVCCNTAVTQLFQCHRKHINPPKKRPE